MAVCYCSHPGISLLSQQEKTLAYTKKQDLLARRSPRITLHMHVGSLNCMHNRAHRANDHSAKAALASPSWAESEQPLVIVGPLACSVQPGNKLDRRPLNSLACSALSSRTVLLLFTSNLYITNSQSVASPPLRRPLHQHRQSTQYRHHALLYPSHDRRERLRRRPGRR